MMDYYVSELLGDDVCACSSRKGYKEVEHEDSQAADEPGQVFHDEALFGSPQGG